MTSEEVKKAFFADDEVVYHGDGWDITAKIQNIIYGKDAHGKLVVSAELISGHNSLTRVRIKDLEGVS